MKNYYLALVYIIPFLIGASFHYFDLWLSIPIFFTFGIYWLGCALLIGKGE